MKRLVKLLIEEEGIRRTPSVYISMLLAYLELCNWKESEKIISILETLELLLEEEYAYLFLKEIVSSRNEQEVQELLEYLYDT